MSGERDRSVSVVSEDAGMFWDAQSVKRCIHRLYLIALSHGDVLYYQAELDRLEATYKDAKRAEHKEKMVKQRLREINALGKGLSPGTAQAAPLAASTVLTYAGDGGDLDRTSSMNSVSTPKPVAQPSSVSSAAFAFPTASIRELLSRDEQQWCAYSDFEFMVPDGPQRAQVLRRQLLPWKRFDEFVEGAGLYEGSASLVGITPLFCKKLWIQQVMASVQDDAPEPKVPSPIVLFDKITSMQRRDVCCCEGVFVGEGLAGGKDLGGNGAITFMTEPALMGARSSSSPRSGGNAFTFNAQRRQSERIAIPIARQRSSSKAHALSLNDPPPLLPTTGQKAVGREHNLSRGVDHFRSELTFRNRDGTDGSSEPDVRAITNTAPPLQSVAIQTATYFGGSPAKVDVFIRGDRNDTADADRLAGPRKQAARSKLIEAMASREDSVSRHTARSDDDTLAPAAAAACVGSRASIFRASFASSTPFANLNGHRFSTQSSGSNGCGWLVAEGGFNHVNGTPSSGIWVGLASTSHTTLFGGEQQVGDGVDDFPYAAISRFRFTRIIVAMVERLMPPPQPRGKAAAKGGTKKGHDDSARQQGSASKSRPHLTQQYAAAGGSAALLFPHSASQQEIADADYDQRFLVAWRTLYNQYFKKLEEMTCSVSAVGDVMGMANLGLAPIQQRIPQRVIYHLLSSHMEWLLIPLFDRYCAHGCNYITREVFIQFAKDLQMAELAAEVFDKTNQYDTEGMLVNEKFDNLEFDEFIDALLLIGCAHFADTDIYTSLMTTHAKIWELFRVLRRRFGLATMMEGLPSRSASTSTTTTPRQPSEGVGWCNALGNSTSNNSNNTNDSDPNNNNGNSMASPHYAFTDANCTYVREVRKARVSIALPKAEEGGGGSLTAAVSATSPHVTSALATRKDNAEVEVSAVNTLKDVMNFVLPPTTAFHNEEDSAEERFGVFIPTVSDPYRRRQAMLLDAFPSNAVDLSSEMTIPQIQARWDLCGRKHANAVPLLNEGVHTLFSSAEAGKPLVPLTTAVLEMPPPRLPAQLTLVCPRQICVDTTLHFLVGGIFLPNLVRLPGSLKAVSVRQNRGSSSVKGAMKSANSPTNANTGPLPASPRANTEARRVLFSEAVTPRVPLPPVGQGTRNSTDLVVSPRRSSQSFNASILAKASRVGELIKVLTPDQAMIAMVQRRETPGSGGGLLPCAGFELSTSPSPHSPLRKEGSTGGDITDTSLSNLCPVSIVMGPQRVAARATQVARNRWKVTVPIDHVNDRLYLPVVEVSEETFAKHQNTGIAFRISTRPTQCWRVQLEAKDSQSVLVPPPAIDHKIQLELKATIDHLTVYQSGWLRSLFNRFADAESWLLPLASFREHVLPQFLTFPIVTSVSPALVRCEPPLTNQSQHCPADVPRTPLEELFVLFCTNEQRSVISLAATVDGTLAISHHSLDADGSSPFVPNAQNEATHQLSGLHALKDLPRGAVRRPWRVVRHDDEGDPKEAAGEGLTPLGRFDGCATTLEGGGGGGGRGSTPSAIATPKSAMKGRGNSSAFTTTGFIEREGVSMSGFVCFIVYAFLGRGRVRGGGGGDVALSATSYSDMLAQMTPTGELEHTQWLAKGGVTATIATPRSERMPHQKEEMERLTRERLDKHLSDSPLSPLVLPTPSPPRKKKSKKDGGDSQTPKKKAAAKKEVSSSLKDSKRVVAVPTPLSPMQLASSGSGRASYGGKGSPSVIKPKPPPKPCLLSTEGYESAIPGDYLPSATEVEAYVRTQALRYSRRTSSVATLVPTLPPAEAETPRRMSLTTPFGSPAPPLASHPRGARSAMLTAISPRSRVASAEDESPPPPPLLSLLTAGNEQRFVRTAQAPAVHAVAVPDVLFEGLGMVVKPNGANRARSRSVAVPAVVMGAGGGGSYSSSLAIPGGFSHAATLHALQTEFTEVAMGKTSPLKKNGI